VSDEYGQVGPEKPGYLRDIGAIVAELTHGARVVSVKFAARNTMKHIVLATLHGIARIDADPEGFGGKDALFVGIANGQAGWLPIDPEPLHPSYIAQYLGRSFGDGDIDHPLADFINAVAAGVAVWNGVTA
jgi:hypothetical protein